MKLELALMTLLCAAGAAQAADPTAAGLPAGYTFSEYSAAAPVGGGQVDSSGHLYFIDEKAVAGIKSWYIFFDPENRQGVTATITFDAPIVGVFLTKATVDGSNATYGIDVDGDGLFDDYTTSLLIAPERADSTTFALGSNTLTIDWVTDDPGDHIRVLLAVPEPETYALFGAGLAALAWRARRRASRPTAR
jgi:hypothetical protein